MMGSNYCPTGLRLLYAARGEIYRHALSCQQCRAAWDALTKAASEPMEATREMMIALQESE